MPANLQAQLEALRPNSRANVIELVAAAGIDVSPWGSRQDGHKVKNPAQNQSYCFEWAFGGENEPTLLCIWHSSMAISEGEIVHEGSMLKFALELERIATDRTALRGARQSARSRAARARKFDSRLQRAFRKSVPIRVVVLQGEPDVSAEEFDTTRVKSRRLDDVSWSVREYRADGTYRLVRNVAPSGENPSNILDSDVERPGNDGRALVANPAPSLYFDQFSVPDAPTRVVDERSSYERCPAVRSAVLERAAGHCELCNCEGFRTVGGAIFLETHHVLPLCEGGPDVPWNVVAICPNDHRRAHYAEDSDDLFERLIEFLCEQYPEAKEKLKVLREDRLAREATA